LVLQAVVARISVHVLLNFLAAVRVPVAIVRRYHNCHRLVPMLVADRVLEIDPGICLALAPVVDDPVEELAIELATVPEHCRG